MSKYTQPIHVRLYHLQEDIIKSMLLDKQWCYNNGISTTADVVRASLNQYLREYEMKKNYRDI